MNESGDAERPVFGSDVSQVDDAHLVFNARELADPGGDLLGMFRVEEVLGTASAEESAGVDHEHLVSPVNWPVHPEDQDCWGQIGAVEEVVGEADDCFDQVGFEELPADLGFDAFAEQRSLRQDNGKATVLFSH